MSGVLRHAIRSCIRTPGYTLVAVATLALGIGANAAIFSLVYSVLWQPLPFPESDRLVVVAETRLQSRTPAYSSMPNFYDWRDQTDAFESIAAYSDLTYNIEGDDTLAPARLSAIEMSSSMLGLLGVRPALGRDLTPADDRPGAAPVALISHELWRRRFSSDPRTVGRTVVLNDRPFSIVGVMPAGFQFPIQAEPIDLWTPIELDDFPQMRLRDGRLVSVVARLKRQVTVSQAQTQLSAVAQRLEREYAATNTGWGALVLPMQERFVGGYRTALVTLAAAVVFVLLIACANLANLMLARQSARSRELAVRAALGAGRGRLARLLIVEQVVLATAGGLVGLVVFAWLRDAMVAAAPGPMPRLVGSGVGWSMAAFAIALSTLTALLVGIGPALHFSRVATSGLQDRGAASGATRNRFRGALVAAEIALAMVLLAGAGLTIKSLALLAAVDPGFDPDNVTAIGLELPRPAYPGGAQRAAFYREAVERARSIPGVEHAAAAFPLPLGSPVAFPIRLEGQRTSGQVGAQYFTVTADYFATMRIPLRRGRLFADADREGSQPVVVINEAMARRLWPDADPIGQRFTVIDRNNGDLATLRTIVGVVGDVRHPTLERPAVAQMYTPFEQAPSLWAALVLRGAPAGVAARMASEIKRIDRNVPVDRIYLMSDRVARSMAPRRFIAILLGSFAAMAAILTMVGIGGTTAYTVAQRTQEIGVRMALGATASGVLRLVLGGTLKIAVIGAAAGCAGAAAATRLLRTMLFGVTPLDPSTFAAAVGVLFVLVLTAVVVPARRAARVDPLVALRDE